MAESLPDTSCLHAQGLSHAIEMLGDECDFQLAVVDLELAYSGGLEMVSSLRRTVPELPLIVLGVLDDVVVENQVLKAGAQDYLVKGRLDEYNLRRFGSIRARAQTHRGSADVRVTKRWRHRSSEPNVASPRARVRRRPRAEPGYEDRVAPTRFGPLQDRERLARSQRG